MTRPLTDDEKKRAMRLYTDGFPLRRIARLMHRQQRIITDYLYFEQKVPLRNCRYDSLSLVQKQEIRSFHESGLAIPAISKMTGITYCIVSKVLRTGDIDNSPDGKIFDSPERQQIITDLYAQGFTGTQIARHLGVSQAVIYRELRSLGLTRRSIAGPRGYFTRYVDAKGRLTRFRSTWEAVFARYLDDNDLQWAYEAHAWLLSDGSAYIPDFWVPSLDAYFEVKGWISEESSRKMRLFRKEYPTIDLRIVDREAFQRYGIDLANAIADLGTPSHLVM